MQTLVVGVGRSHGVVSLEQVHVSMLQGRLLAIGHLFVIEDNPLVAPLHVCHVVTAARVFSNVRNGPNHCVLPTAVFQGKLGCCRCSTLTGTTVDGGNGAIQVILTKGERNEKFRASTTVVKQHYFNHHHHLPCGKTTNPLRDQQLHWFPSEQRALGPE